jgi:hypothetical protein
MSKHSSHALQITKRAAAFRLRQLLNELGMLLGAFPNLREAFDPDELPLDFILKRDSRTEPTAGGVRPIPVPVNVVGRRRPAHGAEHRGRPRAPRGSGR